ncbi:MAG: YkgJ family cysteine cluster protein [Planctomycetota bacterium]
MTAPGEPWYAEGLRFTCTQCGNCCRGPDPGYVEVGAEEVEALAEFLELDVEEFGRRYVRRTSDGRVSLTEKPNLDCIFWSDDQGCEVYPARPVQCRTFPFWPEVLESPETWDEYAAECPGMQGGRRYPLSQIRQIMHGGKPTGRSHKRKLPRAD